MSIDSMCSTHSVSVERPQTTQDSSGGTKRESWAPVSGLYNIPANIQAYSGKERLQFAQRQLLMTDKIFLSGDYSTLIQRSDRLRDSTGRIFRIITITDVGGQRRLTKIEGQEFLG